MAKRPATSPVELEKALADAKLAAADTAAAPLPATRGGQKALLLKHQREQEKPTASSMHHPVLGKLSITHRAKESYI
eukprot:6916819-Lingulodinium_polyedra.AAC.1